MKHAALFLPLATLLGLSACSPPPPLTTNCPNVAVLEQGSTMTEFLPGRQDVAAEITHAQITGVAGTCQLDKKGNLLTVKFQAGFIATNGPANTRSTLIFPYLISESQGDVIIGVQDDSIPLKFDGNQSAAQASTKPIILHFPNSPDTAATDILVSFHLTPDQLAYNAAHPGQ